MSDSTWWSRFLEPAAIEPPSDPGGEGSPSEASATLTQLAAEPETPSTPSEGHVSLSMISPGVLVGAIAVAVGSRGRLKGKRELLNQKPTHRIRIASRLDLHLES